MRSGGSGGEQLRQQLRMTELLVEESRNLGRVRPDFGGRTEVSKFFWTDNPLIFDFGRTKTRFLPKLEVEVGCGIEIKFQLRLRSYITTAYNI